MQVTNSCSFLLTAKTDLLVVVEHKVFVLAAKYFFQKERSPILALGFKSKYHENSHYHLFVQCFSFVCMHKQKQPRVEAAEKHHIVDK